MQHKSTMQQEQEFPVFKKKWNKNTKKIAVVYPNKASAGVYNLGILIVHNIINNKEGWICERRFIENCDDLYKFDLVGFSWQHEIDLHNIIRIIEKNCLKGSGKVFAGGPCVNNNFNPLKNYVDFFVLGYAENVIEKILHEFENKSENSNFLKNIANIEGIFVPGISKEKIYANVDSNIMNLRYPLIQPLPLNLSKEYVFGNCFLLEIERGCPFKCKFCPLGKKNVVYRDLEFIKKVIDEGIKMNNRKKVIIYTASFTHPKRKEILKYLLEKKLEFSVPSIKAEYADQELLNLIKKGGQRTLTIAPECGETLRISLEKTMKDSRYVEFAKMADTAGFSEIKLYFIIGLPGQELKDLDEIIKLVNEMKNIFSGRIYVSVNPLVPKANTEFCNVKIDRKKVLVLEKYLRSKLKVRAKFASVDNAIKCWKIAKGGV